MAAFVTELFESIFTPGPTRTLLLATNVTFACLQTVLLLLLIATYSIHFVVLSFLSVGLWWAINWFAAEVKHSQMLEEGRRQRLEEAKAGEETETEAETSTVRAALGVVGKQAEVLQQNGQLRIRGSPGGSRSEISTEDEWERVSENERDR